MTKMASDMGRGQYTHSLVPLLLDGDGGFCLSSNPEEQPALWPMFYPVLCLLTRAKITAVTLGLGSH